MMAAAGTTPSSSCLVFQPLSSALRSCNPSVRLFLPPVPFSLPPLARVSSRLRSSKRLVSIGRAAEDSISEGVWEESDGGYDSESDEFGREEELAEHNEVASDGARDLQLEYDLLVKEAELMLGPEERAILTQNELPNVSKISTRKWSLFHSLGLSLQIPLMDKLLERGWDIDSLDKDGFTALHKAVMGKKEAVISHLLRKGANPHVRDKDGATALHYAVQVGAMQTVKLLIKCKVDINVADNDGWTPLHIAIQSRSRDIAKLLLVNGADKTRRNQDGKTPLDISLCYGRDFKSYELAKLLKLVPENRDS